MSILLLVPTAAAARDCERDPLDRVCGDRRPGLILPEEIDLSDPFPDLTDEEFPIIGPLPGLEAPDPENLPDAEDLPDSTDDLPELPIIGPIPTVIPPNPENFPTVDEILAVILGDGEEDPGDDDGGDDGIGVNLPDPDRLPGVDDISPPSAPELPGVPGIPSVILPDPSRLPNADDLPEADPEAPELPEAPRIPTIILPDPDNFPTVEELTD